MSNEIDSFVATLGAKAPKPNDENFATFHAIFPRSNYFFIGDHPLIVKISRSKRPFWGVGKKYVDLLRNFDFFLVLLISEHEGWLFSKSEVVSSIRTKKWKLSADGDYKINYPLPDANAFTAVARCRQRMQLGAA